jgi:tRNA-(ms[2]io[6]A)-hydroxylase
LHINNDELKDFYHKFMVAEASHYRLFIDLAKKYGDEAAVKVRWNEFLDYEREVMGRLELRGDRVH